MEKWLQVQSQFDLWLGAGFPPLDSFRGIISWVDQFSRPTAGGVLVKSTDGTLCA